MPFQGNFFNIQYVDVASRVYLLFVLNARRYDADKFVKS